MTLGTGIALAAMWGAVAALGWNASGLEIVLMVWLAGGVTVTALR